MKSQGEKSVNNMKKNKKNKSKSTRQSIRSTECKEQEIVCADLASVLRKKARKECERTNFLFQFLFFVSQHFTSQVNRPVAFQSATSTNNGHAGLASE